MFHFIVLRTTITADGTITTATTTIVVAVVVVIIIVVVLELLLLIIITTTTTTKRKEGNVLFNYALNTFYLRIYHSDGKRQNPLPPLHGLFFPICQVN